MLDLVALFLVSLLAGANSERRYFWPLVILLAEIFLCLCLIWHDAHHYPGLLSPAFVAMFGSMVIAMVVGLLLGGVFLSPKQKNVI